MSKGGLVDSGNRSSGMRHLYLIEAWIDVGMVRRFSTTSF